jgi:hypothetical protein
MHVAPFASAPVGTSRTNIGIPCKGSKKKETEEEENERRMNGMEMGGRKYKPL